MKVSLNWLREYVDLPATTEGLVSLLTMAGIEVERVETTGCNIPNVIVAKINASEQHPNADRLSVCQVDDGSGTPRQIVCGAKNYKVGDKVPLALPGAKLPGEFTIKVGKLRGVESQGMMCSGKELGLSSDAEGLLILSPEASVGSPIADLYPGDTVLDVEITPNRADLLSHYGIAREIAALTGNKLRAPQLRNRELESIEDVQIETPNCWLYSARKIESVKVGPSPEWLRRRLETVGLRCINNVVDITNYVMMELGQPLHAFDAAKLRGDLRVRQASEGEQFGALDGKTYSLTAEDIVVADAARAVALGGVMGGEDSGVTDATTGVWLEAADFQPQSVRRTSRRLNLASDSSYRFERGIDRGGLFYASQRATELILEATGGTPVSPIRSGYSPSLKTGTGQIELGDKPGDASTRFLELRPRRLNELLGTDVSDGKIHDILSRLGLKREEARWVVPSFRPDLQREVDLIEEIARVIGMDAIPSRVQAQFIPASCSDRAYDRAMEVRRALIAHGLHEARSLTLVPEQPVGFSYTQISADSLQRIKNPMIDDQVVLRPNLLHGLLSAVRENIRAGATAVRLFEIGRVFSAGKLEESEHCAIVLTGPLTARNWRQGDSRECDIFDLKGILSAALGTTATFAKESSEALALSISIQLNGKSIGTVGQLWPAVARQLDATAPLLFAEFDLRGVTAAEGASAKKYTDIPRFPAITRDIAMLAPLDLAHTQIEAALRRENEPLLSSVELFDIFSDPTGTKIPADRRSMAYSLVYRSRERTLTADEVNAAHARLKQRLTMDCGVALRE
jgi:phenylalanyl-tRNA synthetase beta chain